MWISWRASRQDLDMLFMVLLGIKQVYPLDRGFSFTMMVCFYGWLGDHLVSKQLRSQEPQVTPTIHEGWPFVCCQGWWRRMKKSKQGFGPGLAKDKQKPSHASHFPLLNSNAQSDSTSMVSFAFTIHPAREYQQRGRIDFSPNNESRRDKAMVDLAVLQRKRKGGVTNHQIFGPTSNYVEKTKSLI